MTQKDKELLLKDISSRLPYGVKVAIEYSKGKYTRIYDLREIDNDATSELRQQVAVWNYGFYSSVISYLLVDCRPYLRPMSSMTEEEVDEFTQFDVYDNGEYIMPNYEIIDWLNAHYFDYRGLIEKGLALEAPEDMYKYD